jgi:Holliday junction resolvase RusA-like endonuclease
MNEKVTFKVPLLPPSVNQMYKINYKTKQCYLDESVRTFKNQAIFFIPRFELKPQDKVILIFEYHGKFFNNDGTIKKKDVQNLDKCLCDIIFTKLGADDSCVWCLVASKFNDTQEFIKVTIIKI